MTWSYDPTNLSTPLNRVRLMLGDTETSDQLLQDEEIQFFIDDQPDIYRAAAEAAESIAARYQTYINSKSADGKNISYSKITDYLEMASRLRTRGKRLAAGKPYAGGISISDKETVEQDDDRDAPSFELGMHDQERVNVTPDEVGPTP